MNRRFALVVALLLVATFLAGGALAPALKKAHAQSGLNRQIISGSAFSIGGGAAVVSAASGKKIIVKALDLTSDTAGNVQFYDGSPTTTAIAAFYLAQNTPRSLDERMLGEGFKTTSGNALYAQLNGAKLTFALNVQEE